MRLSVSFFVYDNCFVYYVYLFLPAVFSNNDCYHSFIKAEILFSCCP
ncbi:unnamed protein product [Acanthoscelides obtectus]|uniref:Uncharacterized protein n=1 Tax=Acanthoscelides obtectus TaxID=200917 RepID=A0A9P0KSQ6_ACAOB|nr:unnamed protein product [Acanthoscelides obtectus]CAK1657753.1 hypothetical protein AOBTE_LOCUS20517 [Acanthoscelides obtectus]